MRPSRSSAAARDTQPRSTATMSAITPNPDPPVATRSSSGTAPVLHRSRARPLTGCAPSQKKRKVCRCTASNSCSSGSAARSAGLERLAILLSHREVYRGGCRRCGAREFAPCRVLDQVQNAREEMVCIGAADVQDPSLGEIFREYVDHEFERVLGKRIEYLIDQHPRPLVEYHARKREALLLFLAQFAIPAQRCIEHRHQPVQAQPQQCVG